MATAQNCFDENLKMMGQPSVQDRGAMQQWNLTMGLRLLSDQVDRMHRDQQALTREVQLIRRMLEERR